jgi:hypothetical protein
MSRMAVGSAKLESGRSALWLKSKRAFFLPWRQELLIFVDEGDGRD